MSNVYRPMAKAAANYETSLLGEHRNYRLTNKYHRFYQSASPFTPIQKKRGTKFGVPTITMNLIARFPGQQHVL